MLRQVTTEPVNPPLPVPRSVWLLRHVAVCVALTALAFLQEPGMTVVDTKVDLTVNPDAWLLRALHLWNPAAAFGEVQNQAYGYLWPMGPFFAVGSAVGMPGWVIQRLWWALLMSVAYAGVVRLAARLNVGTPMSRVIAGVAFALSPRILTEIGAISIEAWPTAVAPWVLVPLVGLAHGASLRRAVTLSALAVACCGGVNATAVLAALPLALLWLAFLRPLRRRLAAIGAWSLAVACATAWWVVPLLLLGRYSPPFLDYIETARTTTLVTDLATVTRGASHWLGLFGGPHGPTWPAGFRLATDPALIVATIAVAALGIAGLSRSGIPHRRFLVTAFLVGLALVGAGHVTAADGGLATYVRGFLDGAGAPLRNLHKFDVVLRLPLVLGLAHLVGAVQRVAVAVGPGWHAARARSVAVTAAALVAVLGVASPAVAGGLAAYGGYPDVPGYWREAAHWIDAHAGRDRVLVVPGARVPTYDWGRTSDEVIQPLVSRSWAVRNSIPLAPATTIRLLDAVESTLSTGEGSRGLADVLARSGVRYLVLRSDLDYGRSGSARPVLVRQALARSPGLELVAGFGPTVGREPVDGGFDDSGLDVPVRSLEVFEVRRPVEQVVAYDVSSATTVVGGPEGLVALAASGQLSPAPTVLAGDLPQGYPVGNVAVTDSLRRREVAFGLSTDNVSATLGAGDRYQIDAPAHDYLPEWAESQNTVARYGGDISGVAAATSWATVEPLAGSRPEHLPFAAVDGDPTTSWRSAPGVPVVGQWLEVTLARPTVVSQVRLTFDTGADYAPTAVTVTAGIEEATVDLTGAAATVILPGQHATRRIRITVRDAFIVRFGFGGVGIREVDIPGVRAERTLAVVPGPATSRPATVVLAAGPATASCVFVEARTRCAQGIARGSEEGGRIDRALTLPAAGTYEPAVWARPRPGPELNDLLDRANAQATPLGLLPAVTASSIGVPDPAARPGSVLDGDPSTAWQAAIGNQDPWLRLNWLIPQDIAGLRFAVDDGVAATRPAAVTVIGDDGLRSGDVDKGGVVTFDRPMLTDEVTIVFLDRPPARSYDPYANRWDALPVAVGELTALPFTENKPPNLDASASLPCGSGPELTVNGVRVATALTASLRELLERREVPARPCTDAARLSLSAGAARVVVSASSLADPTRVALTPETGHSARAATPLVIDQWGPVERHLTVQTNPTDRILAVRENTNPGWRATIDGRELAPIVVDGWQQGWLLPAGVAGDITLMFTPDVPYRASLIGGAAALAIVLLLAAVPPRRRAEQAVAARVTSGEGSQWLVPGAIGGLALIVVGGATAVFGMTLGVVAVLIWRAIGSSTPAEERRRRRYWRAAWYWLPVAAFGVAGWLAPTGLDDRSAVGPQLAGLVTGIALWVSMLISSRRRGQRAPQR